MAKTPYIAKSKTDNWGTPKALYKQLNTIHNFDMDVCPHPRPEWDGLKVPWGKRNFCNPPYSQLKLWAIKAVAEHRQGKKVVMLIPARTDTIAFHEYILPYATKIQFIKGRLKFIDLDGGDNKALSAPFASMIIVFG